jgi:hypothetical protein
VLKTDTFGFGVQLNDVNNSTVAAVAFEVKRHVTDWSLDEILAVAFCTAKRRIRLGKARL